MDLVEDDEFLQQRRRILRQRAGLTEKDTRNAMPEFEEWSGVL